MIVSGYRRFLKGFHFFCLLGVLAIPTGYFNVATAAEAVRPARVVLLLHGMNSNLKTWTKLVASNAAFDGHCENPLDSGFSKVKLVPNSEGVYCTRINFGTQDRSLSAPKGLDKKTCSEVGGCSGDYSTFETLGKEVATAVSHIRRKLGTQTQIILLGHSRGGLAARAFLQANGLLKKSVVGFITTGSPHAGTPLGRYYSYLGKNCLPESKYDGLFDTGDCADDWRFVNSLLIRDIGNLDLKSPTIGFLSDASSAITTLNAHIAALPQLLIAQLSYDGTAFGCLTGSATHSDTGCGYDIFGNIIPFKPSNAGLNAVLNKRTRDSLKGDGIVPVYSQKMNLLKGWKQPIRGYNKSKRVHLAETEQILDLTTALNNMYRQLGWVL